MRSNEARAIVKLVVFITRSIYSLAFAGPNEQDRASGIAKQPKIYSQVEDTEGYTPLDAWG